MSDTEYKKLIEGRKNTESELNYTSFVTREQLNNQSELKADFLLRFDEGEISFPPTYKIGKAQWI
jgi:hypothetical protein